MRFLMTCGGTAGHINPALAVAARLGTILPDAEFLFIGAEGRMETELVPLAGYEIRTVKITNLHRGFSADDIKHNLATMKNVVSSVSEAKRIVQEFRPNVALGTGGYVCFPVLKAASSLGIPTAVHESNALPGLTTKLLEGSVDAILVGFEESRLNYRHPDRVRVTGTPVRPDFLQHTRAEARRKLGLPDDRPLVVSVWGSLGATRMNGVITEMLALSAPDPAFRFIHSAGKVGYDRMHEALLEAFPSYADKGIDVRDYVYDMPLVMSAADLVICRAGASTLAELTAMGKPAVLVPSPNVTNNHQEKNARVLAEAGGAVLAIESENDAASLLKTIRDLLSDPERLSSMSAGMKSLAVPDAVDKIAEIVLELAEKSRK